MVELTLVLWLAQGGRIEQHVDRRQCAEALGLYQSSIATGRPLLHRDVEGQSRIVLDVRCEPRPTIPVS